MQVKQVIVIRKDLKMRRGKEIAQGAHASLSFLSQRLRDSSDVPVRKGMRRVVTLNEEEAAWINGPFAKVVVRVDSEEDLLDIYKRATEAGLNASLIRDAGRTEFNEPTLTAVAVGPNEVSKVDKITGELELY